MKRLLMVGALLAIAANPVLAAEKFEIGELKLSLEAPAGFTKSEQTLPGTEDLGPILGAFVDAKAPKNAAFLMIHHFPLPDDMDYENFKRRIPEVLAERLGTGFKLNQQLDTRVGGFSGMLLDFEAPGNGVLPVENGTFRHRVRWYLLRDGERKLIGLIYHSLADAWAEVEPKVGASVKSIKKIE